MFDFLKKKLKDSIEGLKKAVGTKEEEVYTEAPEEPEAQAEEPLERLKREELEISEEVTEKVEDDLKEDVEEKEAELAESEHEAEEIREDIEDKQEQLKELDEVEENLDETYIESREDAVAREVQAEVIDEVEAELKEEIEKDKAELAEEEAEIKKDKKEADESRELLEKIKDPEKPKLKKKGFFAKMFGKKEKFPEAEKEKPVESDAEKAPIEAKEKKKGVLSGIFEKKLSDAEFEKFFRTLEISLLESNVAYEIIDMIKERLKSQLINKQIRRGKVESIINETLETVFREVLMETEPDKIIKKIENNKSNEEPTKFLFLGVNGVGKTTNMSKLAGWLQGKGYSCVFAASDTFRAASIEQLEKHGSNLGIRVVKHTYGADAAAVAFDAIEHARAKKINCVLIDSAGRQHTNANLMDELHKLKRVAKPDFTVFVADSMTGNDAVEQAREFGDKVGFDWSILAKADVDQKGGAILSVSYISKKPIAFLGVGQEYKDLEPFNKENMIRKILGD